MGSEWAGKGVLMLEIRLNKGYFTVKNGGREYDVWLHDLELPIAKYIWNRDKYLAELPDIEWCYQVGVKRGYTEDRLVQTLIDIFLPVRFFKAGDYAKIALVIGLCGHRGAGKSVGAAMVALFDFILRGANCWSNMPIVCKVCYKDISREYHSIDTAQMELLDLQKGYRGGVIVADECNLSFASAYKTMSGANQDFSALVQQIRKRNLNLIWTAQSFMSIDKNLRFQTDLCVACRDIHLSGENPIMGDTSAWNSYDIGNITGKYNMEYELNHPYITQYPIGEGVDVWMRPFWGLIDTGLLQSNDYIQQYRENKKNKSLMNSDEVVQERDFNIIRYIQMLKDTNVKRIWAHELWQAVGIAGDRGAQGVWGNYLEQNGYVRRRNGKYFYELAGKT